MAWDELAACIDEDPELFFAPYGARRAKAICARCPVRETCLEQNLTAPYGVVGGLTEAERRQERRAAKV